MNPNQHLPGRRAGGCVWGGGCRRGRCRCRECVGGGRKGREGSGEEGGRMRGGGGGGGRLPVTH